MHKSVTLIGGFMIKVEDAENIRKILLEDAYTSLRFKNNEVIKYTPSEVKEILEKYLSQNPY